MLDDQAALKPCVDGLHLRLCAVHLAVGRDPGVTKRRLRPVLPARILAVALRDTAAQRRQQCDLVAKLLFADMDHAAHGAVNNNRFTNRADDTDIVRGLHKPRRLHAHGADTEGHKQQKIQYILEGCLVHHAVASLADFEFTAPGCLLQHKRNLRLLTAEGFQKVLLRAVKCPANLISLVLVHTDHDLRGSRDGIILLAARDPQRLQHFPAIHLADQQGKHQDRVRPVLVDLRAGVSAAAACHGDAEQISGNRVAHNGEHRMLRESARTAREKHALVLGIDVEPATASDILRKQLMRTVHSGLLIDRRHKLDRRVRKIVRRQNREPVGKRDPVIAAEGCPLRIHELSVLRDGHIKAFLLHILSAVLFLHGHHIHVSLKNNRGRVLTARRRVLPDDHVAAGLRDIRKSVFLRKILQIPADRSDIARAVRNRADLLEIFPDPSGLQSFQHILSPPFFRRACCGRAFYHP